MERIYRWRGAGLGIVNHSLFVAAGLLAGSFFMSASWANQQKWDESCNIHTFLEETQDTEHLGAAGELRKSALKSVVLRDPESEREGGLLSELRVVKLKQANLINHVRNLSRCMDGFAKEMPADVEQKISDVRTHLSHELWSEIYPKVITAILAIFALVLIAIFGVAHFFGVEIKRKPNH